MKISEFVIHSTRTIIMEHRRRQYDKTRKAKTLEFVLEQYTEIPNTIF